MHIDCLPPKMPMIFERLSGYLATTEACLAGGTGIAFYLGHRLSVDIDLFTPKSFQTEEVVAAIKAGQLSLKILSEGVGTFVAEVENTKFSLFTYPYPFIDKTTTLWGGRVAGLLDIASMKVIAISQRGTKRDFVDLFFILRDIPFRKIANNMLTRFGAERISPTVIGKALIYFVDAESDPEPRYIKKQTVEWAKIKRFFVKNIKQFVYDLHEL
ncbi:MAG: nucleotidyl transferase AbiEii/AbiGii toxin family protein [Deltaproteobacteria bacterium]|nr:nucleotidyl transferase AbiEii/AbiGii toxin family protein [Deltaproteobacteria bacterium]